MFVGWKIIIKVTYLVAWNERKIRYVLGFSYSTKICSIIDNMVFEVFFAKSFHQAQNFLISEECTSYY